MGRVSPTTSLSTWGLALLFLAAIDAGITRTSLLWGPTAFENSRGLLDVFPQTYRVARKIYAPERDAAVRVALLGHSRIALSARETTVERELRKLEPGVDVRVDNLGIFAARFGDLDVLSRHLDRYDPSLVVVTVSGSDLLRSPVSPMKNPPSRLLRIGWSDGLIPARSWGERADRWLRTVWPLYRFREFARAALEDRVLRPPDPGRPPESFPTTRSIFDLMHGEKAPRVEAAHQAWRAQPTLEAFVSYLRVGSPRHLKITRQRASENIPLTAGSPTLGALDRFLESLGEERWPTLVLMMPENPLLDLDTELMYHRPEVSERGAELIRRAAQRHGLAFTDGRRWLPAESFLDFDHMFVDLSGFEKHLAREISNVL